MERTAGIAALLRSCELSITAAFVSQAGTWLTRFEQTDPFAEADEDTGEAKQSQNYIHIRIQRMLHSTILCPV